MSRKRSRSARERAAAATSSGRSTPAAVHPFVVGFLGVLLLGGIAVAAFVFARMPGGGARQAGAPAGAVQGVDAPGAPESGSVPGLEQGHASAEPGTWFTPEGDPVVGSPTAPVTIVEFGDYQCPNCAQFALEVLPWLRESWIASGMVRVLYRDFAIRGEASILAASAAHCAGEQGRYWAFHDRAYAAHSGGETFSVDGLVAMAAEIGLDGEAMEACLRAGRYVERVRASTEFARGQGFDGTPTYLIDGREVAGALAIADWESLFRSYERDFASATESAAP